MKLIDLLVRELPGRGGWRSGYSFAVQNKSRIVTFTLEIPVRNGGSRWVSLGEDLSMMQAHRLSEDWDTAAITREQYEAALEAVSKPEWDGDGLPIVGCNCEMQDAHGNWVRVTISSHNEGFAIGWDSDNKMAYVSNNKNEFRPIRTEAERKREAAISAMASPTKQYEVATVGLCGEIYDAIAAGKIPGVRLDDEAGR